MKCVIRKSDETAPGKTTITLQQGESIIVIKEVPAEICPNCGEYYLDEPTTEKVQAMARQAAEKGVIIEILPFAA